MEAAQLSELRIELSGSGYPVVDDATLSIQAGRVLALVGESGSGKSTLGLSLLGYARSGVELASGSVAVGETDILTMPSKKLRVLRGRRVSHVPQDPTSALNPALTVGRQLSEVLTYADSSATSTARNERIAAVLNDVRLPTDSAFLRMYPHQLSGGQQQRIGIAMAFVATPQVIVMDEPTTGLDVITQSHVLETVKRLTTERHVATVYITHDLGLLPGFAHDIAVMYAGRIVEYGTLAEVFERPQHPYTLALSAAVPSIDDELIAGLDGRAPAPKDRSTGCTFAPRCVFHEQRCDVAELPMSETRTGSRVRCVKPLGETTTVAAPPASRPVASEARTTVLKVTGLSATYGGKPVVDNVTFAVGKGECVALVGESGSGKTTLSRCIAGLHRDWSGEVTLDGKPLARTSRARPTQQRLDLQYVFQNPYSSFNPRQTIGESVSRPLRHLRLNRSERRSRVEEILDRVSLSSAHSNCYPDQLSGGERQRAAIARSLVCRPKLLVCDEVTSALDVLVQASIMDLLLELKDDFDLSLLFVTHNLPVVNTIAQRVIVLRNGRVVESGSTREILRSPSHPYTQELLDCMSTYAGGSRLSGTVGTTADLDLV